MLRNLTLAALPMLSLTFAVACSTSTEDELAGEADEELLDGKADIAADGASTYYALRPDYRRCVAPLCGGFHLDRLNASKTTCHDGSKAESCYTPELDWSQAGLTDAQQDAFRDKSHTIGDGVHALVRGRFAKTNSTSHPAMGRFIITEAWVAEGEGASDGVFAKVLDNGLRCITFPCPSLSERALNSSRRANISDVDFGAGTFTDAALERLINDYVAPSGIIVAGDRYTTTGPGGNGKGRTATQAYRNVANNVASTAACYVGGCSSQICSDQPGAISTCEYRPEYACYASAACERQTDGECGWTATAELQSCLGDPTQM